MNAPAGIRGNIRLMGDHDDRDSEITVETLKDRHDLRHLSVNQDYLSAHRPEEWRVD